MRIRIAILAMLTCSLAAAQPTTVIEWTFDDGLEGWSRPNHITDLHAEDGAMAGRILDWDPFVSSPRFEIPATPTQVIEVRLRSEIGGTAEFFWTNTTETQYGGFSPGKETHFEIAGDNEWQTIRVRPWWHAEGSIILLRLDLPRPPDTVTGTFAVDAIRIIEPGDGEFAGEQSGDWSFPDARWTAEDGATAQPNPEGLLVQVGEAGVISSPAMRCDIADRFWVAVEMAVTGAEQAELQWVGAERNGIQSRRFGVIGDGRMRVYNVDLTAAKTWEEEILLLRLRPGLTEGATAVVRRITIASKPMGPPRIEVLSAGLANAINRAGRALPFAITLTNRGGEVADDLRIADLRLPGAMRPAWDDWRRVPPIDPFTTVTHAFDLLAPEPVSGSAELTLSGRGAPGEPVRAAIEVTPDLGLPSADYVPEPRPVATNYEIGAYYFPGWPTRDRWERVRRPAPERKPVLGWYDESDPEVADWQIKWAVEHGISVFMVDWYWNRGSTHLMHWLENAYMNARYRGYLKYCLMWANHNPPGSHSIEDQRTVTRYWLDNYFGMDEYYTIDGMPVVIIWSPARMRQDMGGSGGVRELLETSQQMAHEAGYPGICFVAMKWPEAGTDPAVIEQLADEGFARTSIYHYMGHGGAAEDPRNYPFELVAQSTLPFLRDWHAADILPFFPAISTGWDSRPWHGDSATVIRGRTVPLFRSICEDVKRFADETGITRITLGPLNEWGEGSYIEPNREFGFGMYDAVRDTFCEQPPGGWPPNVAPQDVSLGPYDLPEPAARTAWDFDESAEGWGALMGVADMRIDSGALCFRTTSHDPALQTALLDVRAAEIDTVTIRMKIEGKLPEGDRGQLFWSTTTAPVSEATSVRFDLIADGEYHTYDLPVGENPRWSRRIDSLRFDPCSAAGVSVCIDEFRMH